MLIAEEHLFAPFVRILGKGRKGSRGLTRDEAYTSMSMVLRGEIEPEQLGAFLMLLRVKEETPEEIAGFVSAVRDYLDYPASAEADLDWSSYAGKRRHSPWYVLSALLLAHHGIRVCMHGAEGHTAGRMYTSEVLQDLGVTTSHTLDDAREKIKQTHFCYLPLQAISPRLKKIIELRPLLGLRSPVHTVGRMINPLHAPYSIQAIFHPGYQKTHQQAAQLLGDTHLAVFKGEAGEVERNPDTECTVSSFSHGEMHDEVWPPLFGKRHIKEEVLRSERLPQIWRGNEQDEYAEAAIIATAAIALRLMEKARSPDDAMQQATTMWQTRDKSRH